MDATGANRRWRPTREVHMAGSVQGGRAGGATMARFGGGLRVGGGRRGGCPRREGGDRRAQGRVGGEDAEVAVAVNSRRRHQRGEALEQLERGQALRATAAGARFRGVVDKVLAVELSQAVQGERWPGAVPEQLSHDYVSINADYRS